MKLFITGFTQVFFIAINTFFISKAVYGGVFICGFVISFIWSWNVKKVAFGTMQDRLWYSLGAGVGSLVGLIVSVSVFQHIG
jgi:drug/metabolite transporter superfamily protein YnfA